MCIEVDPGFLKEGQKQVSHTHVCTCREQGSQKQNSLSHTLSVHKSYKIVASIKKGQTQRSSWLYL